MKKQILLFTILMVGCAVNSTSAAQDKSIEKIFDEYLEKVNKDLEKVNKALEKVNRELKIIEKELKSIELEGKLSSYEGAILG